MIIGQLVKEPGDEVTLTFDLTDDLDANETIDTAVLSSHNDATLEDSTATFLTGAAEVIATPLVSKRCHGGAHGETHMVQLRATTNFGNVYEHEIEVMVAES